MIISFHDSLQNTNEISFEWFASKDTEKCPFWPLEPNFHALCIPEFGRHVGWFAYLKLQQHALNTTL